MKQFSLLFLLLLTFPLSIFCQKVDFTLKYNSSANEYEVYALPNFSQEMFFVGGGSQLSLILPADIANKRLLVETVNGGPWLDNSQVYAPKVDEAVDFHGIASNGSPIQLVKHKELLLFTFQIPEVNDQKAIRLFENKIDPSSSASGMGGGDFKNYFACAFTMKDAYRKNYYVNEAASSPLTEVVSLSTSEEQVSGINSRFNPSNEKEIVDVSKNELVLLQNQPNPFEKNTTISFYLPKAGEIELTFKDEIGRLIKSVKEYRAKGFNQFRFSRTNFTNKGIIVYQLKTESETATRKMLLVH